VNDGVSDRVRRLPIGVAETIEIRRSESRVVPLARYPRPTKEEQMVARVTHARVNPENIDEAVRLFDGSVVPAAKQEEGFMGAMLLVRSDGHTLAIDLCDTLENMQQNERNGFYQTQIVKFADKIVEHPSREIYEVKVAKGVRGGLDLLVEGT
jgi:hypothetical protein